MAGKASFLVCILLTDIQDILSQSTIIEPNKEIGVCTCNLTPSACDVNCCCDNECNKVDTAAFTTCVDVIDRFDPYMCSSTNTVTINDIPTTVPVTSKNLFCIDKDNFQPRHYYTIPETVEKEYLYNAYKQFYQDFSFTPSHSQVAISDQEYKSGDPVQIEYDSGVFGYFEIPGPGLTNECTNTGPVAYLYDREYECSHPTTDIETLCQQNSSVDINSYHKGFRVVTNPTLVGNNINSTFTQSSSGSLQSGLTDPGNRLISIVPSTSPTCYSAMGMETTCNSSSSPSPEYDVTTKTCQNVVTELQYVIHHQGRGGIFRVDLDYTLKTITQADLPLAHKSKIRFYRFDHVDTRDLTEKHVFVRSGNPGYVAGLPVMAGKRRTDPTNANKEAISLSRDSDEWFNLLKSTATGDCITETVLNNNRQPVLFGINMRSGCLIRFSLQNMTYACNYTQQVVLNVLEGQTFPDYVASFGNSGVELIGDWVPILSDNKPQGAQSSGNGVCTGMVMGMHIEIVYANIGSLVNPQPKIIGVRKLYEEPQTLRYQCTQPQCSPNQSDYSQPFEVTTSVSYIDVSLPNVIVSANVPPEQAKLPRSFFWPFYFTSTASHEYSQVILFVATLTLIWSSIL